MDPYLGLKPGQWSINRSIVIELDAALTFSLNPQLLLGLSPKIAEVVNSIPEDWVQAWNELWGSPNNYRFGLEQAGRLAGSIVDDDYGQATLPIRDLTVEAALDRLEHQAKEMGLSTDSKLEPQARLIELGTRKQIALYKSLGFKNTSEDDRIRRIRQELSCAVRILSGSDLHSRFWLLLDRFYYETYQPWRKAQLLEMDQLEMRAHTALGNPESVPTIDWLPTHNALLRQPELQQAVKDGRLHVFFWVEPFGLADTWLLEPGFVAVSFAEGGQIFQNFKALADDVAARAQALGDPTRLIILRMIRHFGMVNTEIANYLGVSRPTVSVHAKILRKAGLIDSHPEGRLVRHEVKPAEIRRLFRDLESFLDLPPEE